VNVSPRKAHLDTDARGKRHASRSGTPRGVKPADNVPTSLSRTKTRATPAIYADERNLRLKRRKLEQVKWLIHLAQKGGCLCLAAHTSARGISRTHPAQSRQATDRENTSTRNWGTLTPLHPETGRENASTRNRGRRQRNSQMPCCNDVDTVKVCQGKTFDERNNG
jgi:hypothetical protein